MLCSAIGFGFLKQKLQLLYYEHFLFGFSQIQVGHSRFDRSLLMNYPLLSFHYKLTSVLFKIKFLLHFLLVKYCLQPAYNEMLFPAFECQRISRKWNICAAREQQGQDEGPFATVHNGRRHRRLSDSVYTWVISLGRHDFVTFLSLIIILIIISLITLFVA